MFRKLGFLVLFSSFIIGCQSAGVDLPSSTNSISVNPTNVTPLRSESLYRLNPGDIIDIRFFFNPELNEHVQIRPDGTISMQLIDDIKAEGLSIKELVEVLKLQYATLLTTPEISVQVREFSTQKIYITGEVVKPGLIPLRSRLTILEAISESGGVLKSGKKNQVLLIRKGTDGLPIINELAIWNNGHPTPLSASLLQPLDILIVPERGISKTGRWIDDYIRRIIPFNLTAGFQYVWSSVKTDTPESPSLIPF